MKQIAVSLVKQGAVTMTCDRVDIGEYRFKILKTDEFRILRVQASPLERPAGTEVEEAIRSGNLVP